MPSEVFQCPSCSAPIDYDTDSGDKLVQCNFCGSSVTVPKYLVREAEPAPTPESQAKTIETAAVSYQVYTNITPAQPKKRSSCALLLTVLMVVVIAGIGLLAVGLVTIPTEVTTQVEEAANVDLGAVEDLGEAEELGFATQVNAFGTEGGQFEDIRSIAVDTEGRIFVGEYSSGRIQVFSGEGEYLREWNLGNETPLLSMGIGEGRDLYAVYQSTIHRYDLETGGRVGQLEYAGGDFFDDIYVGTDGSIVASWRSGSNGNQLVWFDPQGFVRLTTNVQVEQDGGPELDTSVALDSDGNTYLLAGFADLVIKFDSNAQYLNLYGSPGDGPGQFQALHDIAVDNRNRVYISDFKGIQVFDPDGNYLALIGSPQQGPAFGMTFTQDNRLLVAARDQVIEYQINE